MYASVATVGFKPIEFDTGATLSITPRKEDVAPVEADISAPIQAYYKPSPLGLRGPALEYYIKCLQESSPTPFTRLTGEENTVYLVSDLGLLDPLRLPSLESLVPTDFGSDYLHSGPDFPSLYKAFFWVHSISIISWLIWVYCLGGRLLIQLPLLWCLLTVVAL
jgi:hypothetical protein